jgi:SAM-dependent methyltransferase
LQSNGIELILAVEAQEPPAGGCLCKLRGSDYRFAMPFRALLTDDPKASPPAFIIPPFSRNYRPFGRSGAEISGYLLIQSMCRRLGWRSLEGKHLLDYGCGFRFTQAIVNLDLDIGRYVGVETDRKQFDWFTANVKDQRFQFHHFDMRNTRYNPAGASVTDVDALSRELVARAEAACMFSVVTHTDPGDSETIFRMLHACVAPGGQLYFTALTDEAVDGYVDANPEQPLELSTYNPDFMIDIVERAGWAVERIYAPSVFQQTAFVCRR